ncbi:MAG: hypothetical protein IPK67_08360 [Planctomycetes bacterium]|jgi:hypothetical protein|nr:hypothetical protein [Planctomycetota bacterium]
MLNQAACAALVAAALTLAAPVPSEAASQGPAKAETSPAKDGLTPREQKELGGLLKYALDPEKQGNLKEKDKAVGDLRKFLEKVGKTRNSKDPLQGGLALTQDLSRGLHIANEYRIEKTKPGQVSTATTGPKSDPVSYALWLPKVYRPTEESYPLLVCFPGMKDGKVLSGENFLQDNWIEPAVREKALIVALNLPEEVKSWTERQTSAGKPGGVDVAMLTLREISMRYAIDFDRIYACGRESGVPAALALAGRFPQNFAGVIGRAGDCGEVLVDNYRNLPTFFAGAGAQAAAFEEAAKKLGYENCTLKSDGTDADAWAWISTHPRASNPLRVTLVPKPFPLRSYWIKIPPIDMGGGEVRVEGEIDRSKNQITITSTGVRQISVMLNDDLVDLNKPVTFVLNGTSQEALLPRSLDETLSMMFSGASEPGRIYTVRKDFDLPAAAK